MPTVNQLVRRRRAVQHRKSKSPALYGSPQLSGRVMSVFVRTPKKPNSAQRHCCKVRLSNGEEVIARLPGENSTLSEHAVVLVRGGKCKDVVGCRYTVIRGTLDFSGLDNHGPSKCGSKKRNQKRSKFGAPRPH